ncbi:unnamed protein product, partial [Rotaria sp. Silwood1]
MKFILVELLLLFCIFNIDIDALPINNNTSQINNSTLNLEQKVTNSKDHLDKSTSILSTSLIIPKIQIPENFNISQIEKNLKDFGIHSLNDDTHYAAYFSFEQLATCLALVFLALLRRRW